MTDTPDPHPAATLDDIVHQPTRLGILTVLSGAGRADFVYIREILELTDGNLSRHLRVLADHDLVKIEKGYEGNRPRTSVTITANGRKRLNKQVRAMRALVSRIERGHPQGRPKPA